MKKVKSALISVFNKHNLEKIIKKLDSLDVKIYSTGGTWKFITEKGFEATKVETITDYPSILGGRVKTLHPKIFGGILARRNNEEDKTSLEQFQIPEIDLVIVDLYPFEDTLKKTEKEDEIIEKIDIGGIALIRAAAKNFKDVLVVSSTNQYDDFLQLMDQKKGFSDSEDRRLFAAKAFNLSSNYDSAIFNWMNKGKITSFNKSIPKGQSLRYGENPHQKGVFFGELNLIFEQLHGKQLSYNNIQDLDAGIHLIKEFQEPTFAILKHNNACGLASRNNLLEAWKDALAGDPVSAFGGVLITNGKIEKKVAEEINKLFFEIILAIDYSPDALEILQSKKNRIILKEKETEPSTEQFRTALNGVLWQDYDSVTETEKQLQPKTNVVPDNEQTEDLLFANKIVKHTKSNAIVLVKNKQLVGIGTGQTSRIDALNQAIDKAKNFNLPLEGGVMASDAFFPFADSVETAAKAGIKAVIQPGGSIRDKDSIEYCNENNIAMVFTGIRHFKH